MLITGIAFFVIHNIIIKGMPKIAAAIGVFSTAVMIITLFIFMIWSVANQKKLLSLIMTSSFSITGYSTYALIFIRSNQDPGIDENDPETVEALYHIWKEQYGSVGFLSRRFEGIDPIHEVVGYPEGPNRDFSSAQNRKYRNYKKDKQ